MRLEEAFNKNYNRFTENEQYICRYLLEHKKECAVMSITEFAGSCHVSESMLVRFCKEERFGGIRGAEGQAQTGGAGNRRSPGTWGRAA